MGQQLRSKEGFLRALKECLHPFLFGLVICISGGKKGAKFPWSWLEFWILCLRSDVRNCIMAGEMCVQDARGSLVRSSDLGRIFRSWSVMRLKGTYL